MFRFLKIVGISILYRIFVADPKRRITIEEIKNHPWFLKDLPEELTEKAQAVHYRKENQTSSFLQSVEDIMKIVKEAKQIPPPCSFPIGSKVWTERSRRCFATEGLK